LCTLGGRIVDALAEERDGLRVEDAGTDVDHLLVKVDRPLLQLGGDLGVGVHRLDKVLEGRATRRRGDDCVLRNVLHDAEVGTDLLGPGAIGIKNNWNKKGVERNVQASHRAQLGDEVDDFLLGFARGILLGATEALLGLVEEQGLIDVLDVELVVLLVVVDVGDVLTRRQLESRLGAQVPRDIVNVVSLVVVACGEKKKKDTLEIAPTN